MKNPKVLSGLFITLPGIGMGIAGPETWNWQRITLFSLLVITTFILATVPDNYLKEHIWEHIVKILYLQS